MSSASNTSARVARVHPCGLSQGSTGTVCPPLNLGGEPHGQPGYNARYFNFHPNNTLTLETAGGKGQTIGREMGRADGYRMGATAATHQRRE